MKNQLVPFRNVLLVGSLIVLSFTISCKKDDKSNEPTMPPYTETGAGTIACKVDGKVYVPIDETGDGHIIGGGYVPDENFVTVEAFQRFKDATKNHKFLKIKISSIKDTGLYSLNNESGNYGMYSIYNEQECLTNGKYIGKVHLKKLDKPNMIASGTFYFDAIDSTTGKVVHVTEGIFDLKNK